MVDRKYNSFDNLRAIAVVIFSILLMLTIIGIPLAIIMAQFERFIQLSTIDKEVKK
jgi:hypothetical protein